MITDTKKVLHGMIERLPASRVDLVLSFVKFIEYEDFEQNEALLSEHSLAKDWLSEEEDSAWGNL